MSLPSPDRIGPGAPAIGAFHAQPDPGAIRRIPQRDFGMGQRLTPNFICATLPRDDKPASRIALDMEHIALKPQIPIPGPVVV